MPTLTRGQKIPLHGVSSHLRATVQVAASGLTLDFSCFGVDANGKLSDDRYFVFYNQKEAPQGAVRLSGNCDFELDLDRLPETIQKLVFVVTIDGGGEMNQTANGSFGLFEGAQEMARFEFKGSDFGREKAVMIAEIYRRDGWRIAAVGQGFDGGLNALLKHFGGEEVEEAPAPPAAPKVSLDKDKELQIKLEKSAPQLVNISKTLAVSLEKKGLRDTVARVALVLDASGSMTRQYKNGNVQGVVDRIATLAMRLDDDGELDTWVFATQHEKLVSVSLSNVDGYIKQLLKRSSKVAAVADLGASNNEPPVMREIFAYYRDSTLPALVVFISDGGVKLRQEIKQILTDSSGYPIFWQFVGLGNANYGVLRNLDTMEGRVVDNANFFQIDDWETVSDTELYDRLLNEFPLWIQAAKNARILR